MRLLHYLEIENFKCFGDKQRIELDHPAVLIGPNNCGKTSALQALALWSQAVRAWYEVRKDSTAKERPATSLNRLNILAVPVSRTRLFWHNTHVRKATKDIAVVITVGVVYQGKPVALAMPFRNQGNDLVYCSPSDEVASNLPLIEQAAKLKIELLYPMSGLETEEPLLQSGRIDVLLGQGQTAQVLRNLCLIVTKASTDDWKRIAGLMQRLFNVELSEPQENLRGSIDLQYRQKGVKEALDLSSSGRGFQQMLLIFAYLYSHKGSVLMVDEPDAHLEILRQKQVYVLLRDIAHENGSQVLMVTHSEVILEEALENNLTLLLDGNADNLAKKHAIRSSLSYFGADHYVKARERGYVLYVEGSTDVDILRALAIRLEHPVAGRWDERINSFYVQDNHPEQNLNTELERVEGAYGIRPRDHFNGLRQLLPQLKGLAILDNDGVPRTNREEGALKIVYWKRYEAENYFITPELLRRYAQERYPSGDLFTQQKQLLVEEVLAELMLEQIFEGEQANFLAWQGADATLARALWEAKTERRKLSTFAEDFFRRLADQTGDSMLLRKGEFHRLVALVSPDTIAHEVHEKLDLLAEIFPES